MALVTLNRYAEAIVPARRAVELAPDDFRSTTQLGVLLDTEGLREEAAHYLERATQLDPNSAPAHQQLGTHLATTNQHEKAVTSFQRAIEIEESSRLYELLGASLASLKRWPEAETAFQRRVELEPNHRGMLLNLAVVAGNLGKTADVVELCQRALKIEEDARGYSMLGSSLATLERWTEAEVALRRGLEFEPHQLPMIVNLAVVLATLDRYEEAAELLQQSLHLDPDNVTVRDNLALLRAKRAKLEPLDEG